MTDREEHLGDVTLKDLVSSIVGFSKLLAAIAVSTSIIGGAVWFVSRPYIEPYLEKVDAIENKVIAVENTLNRLLNAEQILPSIEIRGNGLVVDQGPFRPGQTVAIGYWLRRNEQCGSRVLVRFFRAETGRFPTELTYEISGTPANASSEYQWFIVNVRLPDDMEPGRYMYQPIITPQGCSDGRVIVPPPSEFFMVDNDAK